MSMELIAVLPGPERPDPRRWHMALHQLGLPWRFDYDPKFTGFVPMTAGRVVSGVEIYDDTEPSPGQPAPHRTIALRWGGDTLECACAFAAAAGLAHAFGATIHDPAADPSPLDPAQLGPMAAQIAKEALEAHRTTLTVQKVVRAVSQMQEMGWRFVVDGRIVCRSIDGPYLRGLHVDRVSAPGTYRLRAMQTPWCMLSSPIYLNNSVELRDWLSGGLDRIVEALRAQIDADPFVRRCLMADPGDPFLEGASLSHQTMTMRFSFDSAIIQALEGDGPGALPGLRAIVEHHPEWTSRGSDHRWRVIPDLIACIERGDSVAALLHPLAEEAKQRIPIKPIRLRKPR